MTKLFVNIFFFLLAIFIPFYVSAHSNGAATCNVDLMATQGHGPSQQSGSAGYSITTAKSSGQQFSLTIKGSSQIMGVLLYVQDSSGKKSGTFTFPSGYQACTGSESAGSSALTHTSSNLKTMPLSFTWTPPSGTPGNMTIRGIVVQSYSNWHKLQDINFDLTSGASSVSNNTNLGGSNSSLESSGGIGNWFKTYSLFVILMVITIILYVAGSVTEAMLKNQRTKAKYYRTS